MTRARIGFCVLGITPLLLVGAATSGQSMGAKAEQQTAADEPAEERAMHVHYLEIVTPDVDKTCQALGEAHGVEFGDPVMELGNARTAELEGGGRIGVRSPMRETEQPTVRPYMLTEDLDAAVQAAVAAGAEVAIPRMEIPGQGTIAIYLLGGIDHGLWQN